MWLPMGGVASMSNVAMRKPDGFGWETAASTASKAEPTSSQPITTRIRGNMRTNLIFDARLDKCKNNTTAGFHSGNCQRVACRERHVHFSGGTNHSLGGSSCNYGTF